MHLVYFDESGNSGNNLNDSDQPIFVLGGLIIPEQDWQAVERDLEASLAKHFPALAESAAEIHADDLRGSRGHFKGVAVPERVALRDDWLKIAKQYDLKLVDRSIEKKRYQKWLLDTFGIGVNINPHTAAFALVATVVNHYLTGKQALGMLISDENKEIARDVEKSIRQLRLTSGPLRLSQIIEKGFFIDSAKSRILQLCDMCVLHARKKQEMIASGKKKPIDQGGIEATEQLVLRGPENLPDVIAWLIQEQKKVAARG